MGHPFRDPEDLFLSWPLILLILFTLPLWLPFLTLWDWWKQR